MKLSDFDYALPPELIASYPPKDRASARLLHVDRTNGAWRHQTFRDLTQLLVKGDLLILNNTKVLPARIFGQKESGGRVEALLLKEAASGEWEALLRPGKRIKKGMQIEFGDNGTRVVAEVLDDVRKDSGQRMIRFQNVGALREAPLLKDILSQIGHIPLPPYIDRPDTEIDRELYQTVFAAEEGAVASPTAGLHFDQALLDALKEMGVEIAFVTLHVSYGTFQPIPVEDLATHQMFEEEYEVPPATAEAVNRATQEGRRVIACGTTSVRALESAVDPEGKLMAQRGATRLFVYPPYEFKIVKGLITNFHLPKSSLLLLVAALLGREKMMEVYAEAIREKYRFYSYGDAMVIL